MDGILEAIVDRPYLDNDLLIRCVHANNVAHTTYEFLRYCPPNVYVSQVEPFTSRRAPYCRWIIKYRLVNEEIPEPGPILKSLFENIRRLLPPNVRYIRHYLSRGPPKTCTVEYGVQMCDCQRPNFDEPIQTPIEWVKCEDDIKVELENSNPQ